MPKPSRSRHALWAALVLIVIWGANFSVQKAVFVALQPGGFLFLRYLLLPAAATLLLCWYHGLHWPRVPRADLWALLRLGIAGHLLHVTMVTYGIHWSTAFSSSLILACGPIFTLLILRWHGLETLTRAQVAGVGVAMAGVLVFLSDKLLGAQWRASGGDLTLLIASSFFAYYTVASKPLIERHGGVLVMAYAMLLGSAPVVAISAPAGLGRRLVARQRAGLGRRAVGLAGVGVPGLAGVGLDQRRARRGAHRAADVPDAAGGRPGCLGPDRRALRRRQARRRGADAGRRGSGAVRLAAARPGARRAGAGRLSAPAAWILRRAL